MRKKNSRSRRQFLQKRQARRAANLFINEGLNDHEESKWESSYVENHDLLWRVSTGKLSLDEITCSQTRSWIERNLYSEDEVYLYDVDPPAQLTEGTISLIQRQL